MPESKMPRYLNQAQARRLRAHLDHAIAMARADLEADPAVDPQVIDHELSLMLARAACRSGLNLLDSAAEAIARLEAELEQAKLGDAPPRFADGSHNGTESNGISRRAAMLGEVEGGIAPHQIGCRCSTCRT